MAAAAIGVPLALSVIQQFGIPLITKLVDKLMGSGNGDKKMDLSTDLVKRLYDFFASGAQPDKIKDMIQKTVDEQNKAGVLKGHDTIIELDKESYNVIMEGTINVLGGVQLILKGIKQQ